MTLHDSDAERHTCTWESRQHTWYTTACMHACTYIHKRTHSRNTYESISTIASKSTHIRCSHNSSALALSLPWSRSLPFYGQRGSRDAHPLLQGRGAGRWRCNVYVCVCVCVCVCVWMRLLYASHEFNTCVHFSRERSGALALPCPCVYICVSMCVYMCVSYMQTRNFKHHHLVV